ncbi:MAG: hypothetical protein H7A08_04865 [Oceanospirillaceae bacterium]|nr:hypothetical protein [Oceanospirillaceae bacterium]
MPSVLHNEKLPEIIPTYISVLQSARGAKPIQLDNIFETLQLVPAST